jgi:hypothetical protein
VIEVDRNKMADPEKAMLVEEDDHEVSRDMMEVSKRRVEMPGMIRR